MKPTDDLVREFHEHPGSGQPIADYPTIPTIELTRHRWRLVSEEFKEVEAEFHSLLRCGDADEALEAMARLLKEMCDLRYVLDGTAVSLGLPFEEAYRAVHASNMSKVWPDGEFHTNENGKVIKPPTYQPPNMAKLVPPILEVEYVDSSVV